MKSAMILSILLACLALTGCAAKRMPEAASQSTDTTRGEAFPQTGTTTAVPDTYLTPSDRPGTVTRLDYDSLDYVGSQAPITKTAYVYTPYGYDENDTQTRYDVLYLMHGWGGHAGEYFELAGIKTLFDRLIENGDIPPMIIVSPTFYYPGCGGDFGSSVAAFRAFHLDFENHLMPAVEGRFHTYAASTSDEDLMASRDHRAFGGFSLGSVTTWLAFCHDADYIRWFLPMSGSSWYYGGYGNFQTEKNVDYIEQVVREKDLNARGYFIYHAVGTQDAVKEQTLLQAEEMLSRPDAFPPEHYVFYQKEGGYHDFDAVREYLYNALPLFFRIETEVSPAFTAETPISTVIDDPALGGFGRLLFPTEGYYMRGERLGDLRLTWYSCIDANTTVEIVNTLRDRAQQGETVFYDIYTEAEKAADPAKRDTGLFFFRGEPGAKTAICNAGGGFAYVGAMHDSFPHALELSKRGYNAFALIYRPGAQTACEDLARAIAYLHENADALQIDMTDYSLWGGSAGARMAAWLGSYGTASFGEKDCPRPAAVIMQYTGMSEVFGNEPPTYNCVGTADGIASWRTMQRRIDAIRANGTDAEIEIFDGLPHGFGLGHGTVAEGWIDNAVSFWERNMD